MVKRFESFRITAEAKIKEWAHGNPELKLACNTVFAFVLNDYGMACRSYFLRIGDQEYQRQAVEALEQAVAYDPGFVLAHYNLSLILPIDRDKDIDRSHDMVAALAPSWIDGKLARLRRRADLIKQSREEADHIQRRLDEERNAAKERKAANDLPNLQEAAERQLKQLDLQRQLKLFADTVNPDPATDKPLDTAALDTAAEYLWQRITNLSTMRADSEKAIRAAECKMARLREALANRRERAERSAGEARDLLAQIVPHDWLYRKTGELREFREETLDDRALRTERRWERELDDLHVAALIQFAAVLTREHSAANPVPLLKLIRECYYPSNFEVLRLARECTERDPRLCWEADFLALLTEELEAEPGYFAVLTWVLPSDGPALPEALCRQRVSLLDQGIKAGISQERAAVILLVVDEFKRLAEHLISAEAASRNREPRDITDGTQEIWTTVVGALEEAQKIEKGAGCRRTRDDWYWRQIAMAYWAQGEFNQALNKLNDALKPGSEPSSSDAVEGIVKELLKISRTAQGMKQLEEWLVNRKLALRRSADEIGWADTQRAAFALRRLVVREQPITSYQLALWLDKETLGNEPGADVRFQKLYEQTVGIIHDEFCFLANQPRLQFTSGLPERTYILKFAAVVELGTVVELGSFCPYPDTVEGRLKETVDSFSYTYSFNPATYANDGVWITNNDLVDEFATRGYELWPPHEYICRHLRAGILRHLPGFVDYQTVLRLLDEFE